MNKLEIMSVAALASLSAAVSLGCSGDASLGGDKKELGVQQDGSDQASAASGSGDTASSDGGPTATGGNISAATSGGNPSSATGASATSDGGSAVSGTGSPDTSSGGSGGTASPDTSSGGSGGIASPDTSSGGSGGTASPDTSSGGSGGTASPDTSSGGSGGTSNDDDCEQVQCFRPFECVESCGGPILSSSCCPCAEGLLDSLVECPGTCEEGTTTDDGCNTCTCSEGDWICTDRACPEGTPCGAWAGDTCSEDEYCAYVEGQHCGAADAQATCQVRPQGCTTEYDPVCGCDGNTYGNACTAAAAGTGVNTSGECTSP